MAVEIGTAYLTILPSLDGVGRRIRKQLADELRKAAKDEGEDTGETLGKSVDKGFSRFDPVKKIGKRLAKLSVISVAAAGGIGVLASSTALAASSMISLAAALAPAAGILAAFPAGMAIAAGAASTLAVAMFGVADAFKEAFQAETAEEFEEAISGLAPSAQNLARTIRDLQPAFSDLQQTVQQRFFAGFAADARELADRLLPTVKIGMTGVADASNGLVRELADVGKQARTLTLLDSAFSRARTLIEDLTVPLANVAEGFIDIANAGMRSFGGLGEGLGDILNRFADWLKTAAASGQVTDWIDTALNVFSQLGDVLGNVLGIIDAIFDAANAAGGDALGVLSSALGDVEEFLSSLGGQTALVAIFRGLSDIGTALVPVIAALGSALTVLAPVIGDLAIAAAPALVSVLQTLTPVLQAIGLAAIPLLPILGNLVTALGPGVTAVITALGIGLQNLGPSLVVLGESVSDLLIAVSPLLPALGSFLSVAIQVASILLSAVTPAIAALSSMIAAIPTSVLVTLATILLARLIPAMIRWGIQSTIAAAKAVAAWTTTQVAAIRSAAAQVAAAARTVASWVVMGARATAQAARVVAAWVLMRTQAVASAAIQVGQAAATIIASWARMAIQALAQAARMAYAWFIAMGPVGWVIAGIVALAAIFWVFRDEILAALTWIGNFIADWWPYLFAVFTAGLSLIAAWVIDNWDAIWQTTKNIFNGIIDFFVEWWPILFAVFTAGISLLVAFIIDNWDSIWGTTKRIWNNIVDAISGVIDSIIDVVGDLASLPGKVAGWFGEVFTSARNKMFEMLAWLRDLPNKILRAIGNLGSLLWDVGVSLIQGFIDGISSMFDNVKDTLGDLTGALTGWKGPESLDKRLLTPNGEFIMQSLITGFHNEIPEIKGSLSDITEVIRSNEAMDRPVIPGAMSMPAAVADTAGVTVVIDAEGADRALSEWLRRATRVKGGGSVQRFAGQRVNGVR